MLNRLDPEPGAAAAVSWSRTAVRVSAGATGGRSSAIVTCAAHLGQLGNQALDLLCAVIEFLFAEDDDPLQRLNSLCGTGAKLDEDVVGGIGQQVAACRKEVEAAVVHAAASPASGHVDVRTLGPARQKGSLGGCGRQTGPTAQAEAIRISLLRSCQYGVAVVLDIGRVSTRSGAVQCHRPSAVVRRLRK